MKLYKRWLLKMEKGQSLVELVMTVGVAALILPALAVGLISARAGKVQQEQSLQATALLHQTLQAVKQIRNADWTAFAVNGTYHPVISNGVWVFSSGTTTINGFTQSVVVSDAYRDSAGALVSSGTVDPSTKKVVISIAWNLPYASSLVSTLYLTRLGNLTKLDTTVTDFSTGALNGTAIAATSGTGIVNDGQVQLGSQGGADWCNPALPSGSLVLDLPGQGYASDIWAYQGHAFVTSGGNASGDSMDTVSITDPVAPTTPAASNGGTYNLYKTYGLFAGNTYGYITTDHPGVTVDIVQLSNLTHAGYFNASGGEKGQSIFVATVNNKKIGFVTAGSTLYSFDLSTINGTSTSQTQLGSLALNGTGERIVVATGSATPYAYITTSNTTNQLQIVNVSDPTRMSVSSSFSAGNGQSGVDLYTTNTPTYVYMVTSYTAGKPDFFIVNIANPSSPTLTGSYTTLNGMNPKAVIAVPVNRAIIGGSGGEEYQVLDISNPAAPTHCGGLTFTSGTSAVQAIAPVIETDGDLYAYVLTNNASGEFQIIPGGVYQISGGSGGQFSTSGTFTSATFDPGYQSAFNRFTVDIAQPASTTLKLQVAAAAPVNGSCTGVSYTYVGPDDTSGSYFTSSDNQTISGLIPLVNYNPTYQNPGRCFSYKAFFSSSDLVGSPYLYDVNVNYSP